MKLILSKGSWTKKCTKTGLDPDEVPTILFDCLSLFLAK